MKIKCPTCKREGDWFDGLYGPFCSKRSKLVDVGKWFGEEHVLTKPFSADDQEAAPDNAADSRGADLTD